MTRGPACSNNGASEAVAACWQGEPHAAAASYEEAKQERASESEEDARRSSRTSCTTCSQPSTRPTRDSILVVGVIGHPNAGKSSFINSLFGRPVVSASDTPGHTKHLQSLAPHAAAIAHRGLSLGLVFPAVDMPRPLQVLCGIFPVQQLREPYSSIAYLAERVPLDKIYKLERVRRTSSRATPEDGQGAG